MRTITGTTWSVDDAREYIASRVSVDANGCWIWQKARFRTGYGMLAVPTKSRACGGMLRSVHRVSFEVFHGPVPQGTGYHGTVIMHTCDVRACCNPEHLRAGTAAQNSTDAVGKGRSARGYRHGSYTQPHKRPRGESHGRARLTEETVARIRSGLVPGVTRSALARELGVHPKTIALVEQGKTWKRDAS